MYKIQRKKLDNGIYAIYIDGVFAGIAFRRHGECWGVSRYHMEGPERDTLKECTSYIETIFHIENS